MIVHFTKRIAQGNRQMKHRRVHIFEAEPSDQFSPAADRLLCLRQIPAFKSFRQLAFQLLRDAQRFIPLILP
ncbi:hypothetical protein D3C74_488870 [compost metagenome]